MAQTQGNGRSESGLGLTPLTDQAFQRIRKLVYDQYGINLTEQKRSLVVGRLNKLLKQKSIGSFDAYCEYLERDRSGRALDELVNRISTNHTFFYREKAHFEFFVKTALPEAAAACRKAGNRDLRVWCAGCSTGEEPYMLVMLMMEFFGRDYGAWDAGILATDISSRALTTAVAGLYPEDRMSQMPANLRTKYFTRRGDMWAVNENVKREVTYRRFNLMNERLPFKKQFHMVFCRNVMIYFDKTTREGLVRRFHQATLPGGYLFIGHSESLGREECPYNYVMPALYKKE